MFFCLYISHMKTHMFQQTHLLKVKSVRGIYGSTLTQPIVYLCVLQDDFLPACAFSALSEIIFLSPVPDPPISRCF